MKPASFSAGYSPEARCCCQGSNANQWKRRNFLQSAATAAGFLALSPWKAMAGPFTRKEFENLVPSDKKLTAEWVKSLTERGRPTVYRGADLEKIGMPIGGICAGQVYLGGDGRLWHWDIFNQHVGTGAEHYASPMRPASPFEQGFAIRIRSKDGEQVRALASQHWKEVSFNGEYPIGRIEYQDETCPVSVSLDAYSPFVPLETEDSSLPITVMEFTIRNRAQNRLQISVAGWLENAICLHSGEARAGIRTNRVMRRPGLLLLESAAEPLPETSVVPRPDIVFDDFEKATYEKWTTAGTAFGDGPVEKANVPDYQGDLAGQGQRVINTHASAPGKTVEERDSAQGTLTSQLFTITRNYITFLIGGGAHKGRTCINLLREGKIVLSATGHNNNRMSPVSWDVRRWAGKLATLEILDHETVGWGNIGIDDIVFSDFPRTPTGALAEEPDFGTMVLAVIDSDASAAGRADAPDRLPDGAFERWAHSDSAKRAFGERLIGVIGRRLDMRAGSSAKVTFLLSWHMPNLKMDRLPPGRYYGDRFRSAYDVVAYVRKKFASLEEQTRLWHDTWYDSTLPYWFLDRTFLNTSILASSTCYRFEGGRFYAWEGVGCCEGTCGHVWQYAHAMARLFPALERETRQNIDFGLALQPDGAIHFRGEFNDIPAIDAQAGTILRALREHQMSANDLFLKHNWPQIRKATEWLLNKDTNGDGLIESNQHNTLDTDWFGPVAWLSGLYLAALSAAATMAREMGDHAFMDKCQAVLEAGRKNLVSNLFDGEYFINKVNPAQTDAINSGTGCEIDQVFGQSWAWQAGLGRVLPEKETLSALRALWRYNFTPDAGLYRRTYKPGRWYAMPGEAGLLMCTFPRADWDYEQAKGKGPDWAAGYFNECMNGFEYQVAGHMIWESMITEGLAITRAIHDRYHASKRNPWNEVECGDHYARSMASYGVFLAACGFEYQGPKGQIGFTPRVHPEKFKAAFTSAEGWGSYAQNYLPSGGFEASLHLKHGNLRLRTVAIQIPESLKPSSTRVRSRSGILQSKFATAGKRLTIELLQEVSLKAAETLEIAVS